MGREAGCGSMMERRLRPGSCDGGVCNGGVCAVEECVQWRSV